MHPVADREAGRPVDDIAGAELERAALAVALPVREDPPGEAQVDLVVVAEVRGFRPPSSSGRGRPGTNAQPASAPGSDQKAPA